MENPKLSRSKGRYELKLISRASGSFGGNTYAIYDKHLKIYGQTLHSSCFETCREICNRINRDAEAYDLEIYHFIKGK